MLLRSRAASSRLPMILLRKTDDCSSSWCCLAPMLFQLIVVLHGLHENCPQFCDDELDLGEHDDEEDAGVPRAHRQQRSTPHAAHEAHESECSAWQAVLRLKHERPVVA